MDETTGKILADFSLEMGKSLLSEGAQVANKRKYSVANIVKLGVNKYLDKIYSSSSKTKTLLYVDKAIKVDDIYVNSTLQNNDSKVRDTTLLDRVLSDNGKAVISGTAGSGKSMMMKYFVLQAIRTQNKKMPVFFEFRHLNRISGKTLLEAIYDSLNLDTKRFPKERFESCLARGMFIFILDGFDELDEELSLRVERELREMYKKFDLNSFVVASRPDAKLYSSIGLDVYHVNKLSKSQVVELISKVNYDVEKKEAFIKAIKETLYDKHRDFASSPLLVTMMLLTFHQFATVPEKIHLFYSQVYEVLFSRHDVSKEGLYIRDFQTDLPMDDFSSIVEAFSSASYLKREFYFTNTTVLRFSEEAISYCGLDIDKQAFVTDMLKSVCLLIRDGNRINFTHRSFQEYFCALFISRLDDILYQKFITAIKARLSNDSVLHILFGLQRERFEKFFIMPMAAALLSDLGDCNTQLEKENALACLFKQIQFAPFGHELEQSNPGISYRVGLGKEKGNFEYSPELNLEYLAFIIRCFPAYFEWMKTEYFSPFDEDDSARIFLIGATLGSSIEKFECADLLSGFSEIAAVLSSKSFGSDFFLNLVSSLRAIVKDIEEKSVLREISLQQIFDTVS